MKIYSSWMALLLMVGFISDASAGLIFDSINFPAGAESFADAIISYSPGSDVGTGFNEPSAALGIPDREAGPTNTVVSLGDGGVLTLQFTDNSLTTSGDSTSDLYIFEIGGVLEDYNVAISTDLLTWIDLGDVKGPAGIDIDSIAGVVAGGFYPYVRRRMFPQIKPAFPLGRQTSMR